MQSTIDRSGRVVIPKPVRDGLHLTPGTALSVEERNGEIVLKPATATPSLKRKAGVLVFSGRPTGDLLGAVDEHRRKRARKAAGWSSE